MKYDVVIPGDLFRRGKDFLFQNDVEQAVFYFAKVDCDDHRTVIMAKEIYEVPPNGWECQHELYLEMTDAERAKIMKMARDRGLALIDCHSHTFSNSRVSFSPSDITGITDFAAYAHWKLPGRPYTAMVWGHSTIDAVVWDGRFESANTVDQIVTGNGNVQQATQSWWRQGSLPNAG